MFTRFIAALLLVFLLSTGGATAQQPATENIPSVIVSIPIHGKYVFAGNLSGLVDADTRQLFLIDTFSGDTTLILEDNDYIESLRWNPNGERVAYLNSFTTSIFDFPTSNVTNLLSLQDSISPPQDWSSDGSQLLHVWFTYNRYELRILDVNTESYTTLFGFDSDQVITDFPLPPLPSGITSVKFSDIRLVDWNPIYTDWVVVQLLSYYDDGAGDTHFLPINFVYNRQTGAKLSLDQLFPSERIIVSGEWSPDGRYLALGTSGVDDVTRILSFSEMAGSWSFTPTKSAISGDQVVLDWLGAGDLLLTGMKEDSTGDEVEYIAQIIDGTWHYQEFLRFPKTNFDKVSSSDWHITASEQEKQALTCLFNDSLTARLKTNEGGRVTYTDGTGTRLRSEPTTDADLLATMAEGTPFTVLDGPFCADGFKWWQLQLADGTVGWAAEGDAEGYFLEPQ